MSTNATVFAPPLINKPVFDGQLIVFRSPHRPNKWLVDVATRDPHQRHKRRWIAAESSSAKSMVAQRAYHMMGVRIQAGAKIGYCAPVQACHFASNRAAALVDQYNHASESVCEKACDWVCNTLALPHDAAMDELLEQGFVTHSHGMLLAQELIGRYLRTPGATETTVPPFLIDAIRGHNDPMSFAKQIARTLISYPALISQAGKLPQPVIYHLKEFVASLPFDANGCATSSSSFIQMGDNRQAVMARLDALNDTLGADMFDNLYQVRVSDGQRILSPSNPMRLTAEELQAICRKHGMKHMFQRSDSKGLSSIVICSELGHPGIELTIEELNDQKLDADSVKVLMKQLALPYAEDAHPALSKAFTG